MQNSKNNFSLLHKRLNYIGEKELGYKRGLPSLIPISQRVEDFYISFFIPKRNGDKRLIQTPTSELKRIQTCIARLLTSLYSPSPNVYGFIPKRSIAGNASIHVNKDIVYNVDLKDFFHSIPYERIVDGLQQKPFRFSPDIAKLIATLTTIKSGENSRVLPQGSPSSPIITNIVASRLDFRLSKLCDKFSITYSRYADDMTFSFDYVNLKRWRSHGFRKGLCAIIEEIIKEEGFTLNQRKTRISFRNQQQEVTGLIVNNKVNVRREFVKNLRTIIHNWELDGYIIASHKLYLSQKNSTRNKNKFSHMEDVVSGKLSYLKMVKGENDSTFKQLRDRFTTLIQRDTQYIKGPQINSISNIFTYKPTYSEIISYEFYNKWILKEQRPLNIEEKKIISSVSIVSSKYGYSAKFTLKKGRVKFIPLSKDSSLREGDSFNLNDARVLILSMPGKKDILRIKI